MTANPAAGAEVRKLSVDLTVSKGQERYAAPGLVGTPADAASATLTAQHLALGERKEEFSETVGAGTVIAQDPAAGTSLKPGAAVAVTVSKGRQPIDHRLHRQVRRPGQEGAHRRGPDGQGGRGGQQRHGARRFGGLADTAERHPVQG